MKKIIFKNWLGNDEVKFDYDSLIISDNGFGKINAGSNILVFTLKEAQEFEIKNVLLTKNEV